MLTILIRTVIIYLSLISAMRLMGKRQIGELQISELTVTFLLSEIASVPITDTSVPLLRALLPIGFLLAAELGISYILMKNRALRRIMVGTPSILIRRGEIIQSELRKNRIEIEELLAALRQSGCASPADVMYAILEENGKISVLPKADLTPVTPKDLGFAPVDNGIAHPLIVDTVIVHDNLVYAGWTEARLYKELRRRKIYQENVFLLTVDDSGNVAVIEKLKNSKK